MEDQCSPPAMAFYSQDEGMEELRQFLLCTTLELERTLLSTNEEIARKEDELVSLRNLLKIATQERDETQAMCRKLMLEILILQHQQPTTFVSNEDDSSKLGDSNNGFSTSDCTDGIISSPSQDQIMQLQQANPLLLQDTQELIPKKPLPEKGKFLQAVMDAGPLLQTLMLAGPLPQWQIPPPQLNFIEIPPLSIPSTSTTSPSSNQEDTNNAHGQFKFTRKTGLVGCEDSNSAHPCTKFQGILYFH
ncbi:Protein of unknown function DUF1635 [Dillenia turbinata]|uniref:Uncharacterized protein n=1 Tax=Dillenia turbinata TaxID=194707 RepID=A0AAN8VCM2_9MAGN